MIGDKIMLYEKESFHRAASVGIGSAKKYKPHRTFFIKGLNSLKNNYFTF